MHPAWRSMDLAWDRNGRPGAVSCYGLRILRSSASVISRAIASARYHGSVFATLLGVDFYAILACGFGLVQCRVRAFD